MSRAHLAFSTARRNPARQTGELLPTTFATVVQTRWSDYDALGHVYHPVFLTYLEAGRDAWFAERLGSREVYVVARVELDFRRQLGRDTSSVVVEITAEELGDKSIKTNELVTDGAGLVFAQARTTSVRWDPVRGVSVPLSDRERSALMGRGRRQD
jgi:acyl-CoA thioester hydrolase